MIPRYVIIMRFRVISQTDLFPEAPLSLRKMLALCVCPRRVVPPMDPPHTAKAFPNCGQESHTRVHVLALIFKITVLTPNIS